MEQTPGIVDVDSYVEDDQPQYRFKLDQEKAALSGIDTASVVRTLRLAGAGEHAGLVHDAREKEDVPIVLGLDRMRLPEGYTLEQHTVEQPFGLDPAGARRARRLFHGDVDDRIHRGCGHRRAKLHHPRRFHRAAARAVRPTRTSRHRRSFPAPQASCSRSRAGNATAWSAMCRATRQRRS
jgi:hypothetical protein